MSQQSPHCTICPKRFSTWSGVYSHAKAKHPKHDLSALKKLAFSPDSDEPSMAELVIEAQLARAMGDPVEGWIADMFDV